MSAIGPRIQITLIHLLEIYILFFLCFNWLKLGKTKKCVMFPAMSKKIIKKKYSLVKKQLILLQTGRGKFSHFLFYLPLRSCFLETLELLLRIKIYREFCWSHLLFIFKLGMTLALRTSSCCFHMQDAKVTSWDENTLATLH